MWNPWSYKFHTAFFPWSHVLPTTSLVSWHHRPKGLVREAIIHCMNFMLSVFTNGEKKEGFLSLGLLGLCAHTDETRHWVPSLPMSVCAECGGVCTNGDVCDEGVFYCTRCWDEDELLCELRSYRCVTFCALYDLTTGERLGIGGSVRNSCAERNALWTLDDISTPKAVMVCRIRKNRKNTRWSLGMSKPCRQCILAMHMYRVERVCFSTGADSYEWVDLDALTTDYRTVCDTIVSI